MLTNNHIIDKTFRQTLLVTWWKAFEWPWLPEESEYSALWEHYWISNRKWWLYPGNTSSCRTGLQSLTFWPRASHGNPKTTQADANKGLHSTNWQKAPLPKTTYAIHWTWRNWAGVCMEPSPLHSSSSVQEGTLQAAERETWTPGVTNQCVIWFKTHSRRGNPSLILAV